ncbi:MAG: bacteriohemerythrin [Sulfuritalea sp.]|jgi:hemerythrin-like metal-binding protein|nr:bacteriohemerythrin [Sulfuritalea sp.]
MKWDSSFAIGIEAIDNQHEKIFEHLLAIENSVTKRDPWHILRFFLTQMSDYMKFHLAVEEALLEIIRYPDYAEHCVEHARLMEQIAELQDQLEKAGSGRAPVGQPLPAENLVDFFEDWFVRHVLSSDREYAAYVKEEFPALFGKRPA